MSLNKPGRLLHPVYILTGDSIIIRLDVDNFIEETFIGRKMLSVDYLDGPPFTAVNRSLTNRIYKCTDSGKCFFVTPGLDFYMSEGKEDYFYLISSSVIYDKNYKPAIFTHLTELEYTFL